MNKVALLLPGQDMCEAAMSIAASYQLDIVTIEAIQDSEAAIRAQQLVNDGVEIIIARGFQAMTIRQAISVPVVEIRITTQELGLHLKSVKYILNNPHPKIAVITLSNLLRDTSHYSEIFDADISVHLVSEIQDYSFAVNQAIQSGVDAIVGGRRVSEMAMEHGVMTEFLRSSTEGIANALEEAENISYALTMEKQNTAQMQTLLDYAFEGIMQINSSGIVQNMNTTMERLLGKSAANVIGKPILQTVSGLDEQFIIAALENAAETFGRPFILPNAEVLLNIAPVRNGENIEGAILTFLENSSVQRIGSKLRQNLFQTGSISRRSFDSIVQTSKVMRDLVSTAKGLAQYDVPLLLTGEAGSGKSLFARCIHSESQRRENGFLQVDCSGYSTAELDIILFGNSAQPNGDMTLVELAQDGTLFLENIDAVAPELQHKLYRLTQGQYTRNGQSRSTSVNPRIIASTSKTLSLLVQKREFDPNLYYALSVLVLDIPPLRQHKEDIVGWINLYMERYCQQYNRYIRLNQLTFDMLTEHHWPGNINQVKCLCERIVLLSGHRTADAAFVRRQLEEINPDIQPESNRIIVYKNREAVEIADLLRKHNGNREKVAQELGISKTTLWRKMKKFGIASDYTV